MRLGRWRLTAIVLMGALLSGCADVMPRPTVKSLADLDDDEVVLVGKFVLDPPLTPDQKLSRLLIGKSNIENAFYLFVDEDFAIIREGSFQPRHLHLTHFGDTFYMPVKKGTPVYISGGYFYVTEKERMTYLFKKGIKVTPGNHRSLYLGTVTIRRDEFFNIKSMDISQKEIEKADQAFRQRFGTPGRLVKAKVEKPL